MLRTAGAGGGGGAGGADATTGGGGAGGADDTGGGGGVGAASRVGVAGSRVVVMARLGTTVSGAARWLPGDASRLLGCLTCGVTGCGRTGMATVADSAAASLVSEACSALDRDPLVEK